MRHFHEYDSKVFLNAFVIYNMEMFLTSSDSHFDHCWMVRNFLSCNLLCQKHMCKYQVSIFCLV